MSFEVSRTYQRDFSFAMFILIRNIRCKVGYRSISTGFHVDSCYFSTTVNRILYSYRHRSLSHLSLSSLYLSSLPFSLHLFSCSLQLYLWLLHEYAYIYVHYFSLLLLSQLSSLSSSSFFYLFITILEVG